jgi:hypothetical protein
MYDTINNSPYPPLAAKRQDITTPYIRNEMTINITPDKIISDVQKEFNEEFPFLKIEFFKKGYRYKQSSQRDKVIPREFKIGSPRIFNSDAGFNITAGMTVKELEKECEDELGLSIQVYRKSGNLWLETTMTENWTLKQQNDNGREISTR